MKAEPFQLIIGISFHFSNNKKGEEEEMAMMLMGLSVQFVLDFVVAGISLVIGMGLFAFIASILCSAAFFQNAKEIS